MPTTFSLNMMGPVSYCETRNFPVANATDLFHAVSLGSAVITAITFPLTVLGNALVLLAIWRNQSMRSPSFFRFRSDFLEKNVTYGIVMSVRFCILFSCLMSAIENIG